VLERDRDRETEREGRGVRMGGQGGGGIETCKWCGGPLGGGGLRHVNGVPEHTVRLDGHVVRMQSM
jgi:hypothetical protein